MRVMTVVLLNKTRVQFLFNLFIVGIGVKKIWVKFFLINYIDIII
jgi:hypothetical protein